MAELVCWLFGHRLTYMPRKVDEGGNVIIWFYVCTRCVKSIAVKT